jgi:hypothetical protein
MPEVKIAPKLPDKKTSDKDGLGELYESLLADPKACHIVVGVVKTATTTIDFTRGGLRTPAVQFAHIEAVLPQDAGAAERMLRNAYERRTGQQVVMIGLPELLEEI